MQALRHIGDRRGGGHDPGARRREGGIDRHQAQGLVGLAGDATTHLLRGWDLADIAAFHAERFENLCAFVKAVPAFRLHVLLGGRFWEKMEEASQSDVQLSVSGALDAVKAKVAGAVINKALRANPLPIQTDQVVNQLLRTIPSGPVATAAVRR